MLVEFYLYKENILNFSISKLCSLHAEAVLLLFILLKGKLHNEDIVTLASWSAWYRLKFINSVYEASTLY